MLAYALFRAIPIFNGDYTDVTKNTMLVSNGSKFFDEKTDWHRNVTPGLKFAFGLGSLPLNQTEKYGKFEVR